MKVLALESSGAVAAVALAGEDKLFGEFFLDHKKTHSQQLMPLVEELLTGLDMNIEEIDLFVVSKGPGSFTGLRIGISTVKALGQALNKPVIGIPTLDSLAYNLLHWEGLICPIMDARRDQVYTCIYKSDHRGIGDGICPRRLSEYMAIPLGSLIERLKDFDGNVMFNGDGVIPYWDIIKDNMGDRALRSPSNIMMQRASSLAFLALKEAKGGKTQSYSDLLPFYLRKSQAEQKFDIKN